TLEPVRDYFQPVPVAPSVVAITQKVPSSAVEMPVFVVSVVESVSNPELTDKKPHIEVQAFVPPVLESEGLRAPQLSGVEEFVAAPQPTLTASPEDSPAQVDINPDELISPVLSEARHQTPPLLDSLPLPSATTQASLALDPQQPEQDVHYALPDSPEPSYSSVARHIEDTLLGLLDDLSLPERHRPQAEAMRDRLQNG